MGDDVVAGAGAGTGAGILDLWFVLELGVILELWVVDLGAECWME